MRACASRPIAAPRDSRPRKRFALPFRRTVVQRTSQAAIRNRSVAAPATACWGREHHIRRADRLGSARPRACAPTRAATREIPPYGDCRPEPVAGGRLATRRMERSMRRQFARRREDRRDRATIEGTRKHENEAAAHDRVMDGLFASPPPAASAAGADALCRAAVLYRCFARRVARSGARRQHSPFFACPGGQKPRWRWCSSHSRRSQ